MHKPTETLVVTPYSLSFSEHQHLNEVVGTGPFRVMSLFELKGRSLLGGIGHLLGAKAEKYYLYYDDPTLAPLEKVLIGLSIFLRGKSVFLITPSKEVTPVTKWNAFKCLLGIAVASLASLLFLVFTCLQIFILKLLPRRDLSFKPGAILYVYSSFSIGIKAGGSVAHIAGVINGFLNKGFELYYAGFSRPRLVDRDYKFIKIDRPNFFGYPTEINNFKLNQKIYRNLKRVVKKEISFIYQRMSVGNFSGVLLSRAFKVPLVLEYNGSEVWVSKNWNQKPFFAIWIFEAAENICFRHAQFIVTVSEVLKEELIDRGISEDRIIVYPNCVDTSLYNTELFPEEKKIEVRKKWDVSEDSFVVSFLGTFGRWHGVSILADAIKKMYDTQEDWLKKNKVRFLLIGDGLEMSKVQTTLKDVPSEYVRMTGLVEQKYGPELLSISNLLVTPQIQNEDGTRFFGSPTKLFEYMALGKAIIASDLEQIGEILKESIHIREIGQSDLETIEKSSAILTTPGSSDDIMKAIVKLRESDNLRKKIGDNAMVKVKENFTWDHHVDCILNHVCVSNFDKMPETAKKYYTLFKKEDPYGYKKRIDYTLNVVRRIKPKSILDFGCGTGELFTLPLAAKLPKIRIVAYDEDEVSVKYGQTHSFHDNIHFTSVNPITRGERFDLVILSEVIEHVHEPAHLLFQLKNLLTPEGKVLVTTPNGYGAFELLNTVQGLAKLALRFSPVEKIKRLSGDAEATLAISPHVQFFSEEHLEQVIHKAGFEVDEIKNRTFLCGFGLDFLDYVPGFSSANATVAEAIPRKLVSGWMYLLDSSPSSQQIGPESNEKLDSDFHKYENAYTNFKRKLNQRLYLNNIYPTEHS